MSFIESLSKVHAGQVSALNRVVVVGPLQPITRTVLRVRLTVTPNFRWNDRVHGGTEPFWMWVEDPENNHIYHHEYFLISKKQVLQYMLSYSKSVAQYRVIQCSMRTISEFRMCCVF